MIKKISFFSIDLLLFASPFTASAQSADLQSRIAALLSQIQSLQQQISALSQSSAVPSRTLSYGAKGSDVILLQKFLSGLGLLTSDSVTGFFGNQTRSAVKQWQSQNGIVGSGDA